MLGDLVTNKAKHRGIASSVVDGLVRDLPGRQEAGLPASPAASRPSAHCTLRPRSEFNYSTSCGGIAVVRREFAEDTIMLLHAHRARMQKYVANMKAGCFNDDRVDRQLAEDHCLIEQVPWNLR